MLHTVNGSYLINRFLLVVCIATIVLATKLAKEALCIHFQWSLAAREIAMNGVDLGSQIKDMVSWRLFKGLNN